LVELKYDLASGFVFKYFHSIPLSSIESAVPVGPPDPAEVPALIHLYILSVSFLT